MLDVEAIRASLGSHWPGAELRALGSVTSTNDIAWAWAEAGCAEGTTVLAEEQVRGRGRFGRAWHSPRGRAVLMSVVLRPPSGGIAAPHVTALATLAVAEAIEAAAGLEAAIRWPNDVTLRERKAAGILTECRGNRIAPCVVGVGINVNTRHDEFPPELQGSATSLALEAGKELGVEAVAGATLRLLAERYRDAVAGRWDALAAQWRRRASLLGRLVVVRSNGRDFQGRLVASDPVDGVELELSGGERRRFRAEDASLLLPRSP